MLPEPFLQQMKNLLSPGECGAFLDSFNLKPVRGIRFNRLKVPGAFYGHTTDSELVCRALSQLGSYGQVKWCKDGFSFTGEARPSKSVLYHTGLYYIQEPSAMLPVEVLKPAPGERVLDLCAAPGGKTVQITGHMQGKGLLVSNDKSPSRCKGLIKNIELAGAKNVVVTSEEPRRLAAAFPLFFDKILVDAPCSGEGMFRRDKGLIAAYNANKPEKCTNMQKEILYYASLMLKPGGKMAYSTCTFNLFENESVIYDFLNKNSGFALDEIDHKAYGADPGFAESCLPENERNANGICRHNLHRAARIWPHKANGEGHFTALLSKKGEAGANALRPQNQNPPSEFADFCAHFLNLGGTNPFEGFYVTMGTNLYLQPEYINLKGLRAARSGFLLGEIKKGRFVPSQALAMALKPEEAMYPVGLPEDEAIKYLKGETLCAELPETAAKAWAHINYGGLGLGFARHINGKLKNCLPMSWALKGDF